MEPDMHDLMMSIFWLSVACGGIVLRYVCFFAALGLLLCFPGPTFAVNYVWYAPNEYQWALLDYDRPAGQRQIGIWDTATGLYTPLIDGEWGAQCSCPSTPPPGISRRRERELPTGVDHRRLPQAPRIWRNGKEISHGEAMKLLAEDDKRIPDDKALPRCTIIGSSAACAAPLAVAKHHSEYVTMEYRPDAWMIARQGFYAPSDPTIYIQKADGTVIRRLDGYEGDEKFEAALNGSDRKIAPTPNYDPSKDDGWLSRIKPFLPALPGLPKLNQYWLPISVIGGLLFMAVYTRKQKL
jgi:hypothetical protein